MTFKFDFNKKFPQLSNPPIVEAVLHWQARAQSALDAESLRPLLLERLPEYTTCDPVQHLEFLAEFSNDQGQPVVQQRKKSGWHGFRLTTEDGRHVVQFNRDGVIFSCTRQYDHWENFTAAAKRVWGVFLEIANPVETERLGVRFINQFKAATLETLGDFLLEPPTRPPNLPLKEFVYQSTLSVPGHPFEIRVIKVMQPSMPEVQQGAGLFVDLDVYLTSALSNDVAELGETLRRMRYLKNEVFFTLLKPEALQ